MSTRAESTRTLASVQGARLWRRLSAMVYESLLVVALALLVGLAAQLFIVLSGGGPDGPAWRATGLARHLLQTAEAIAIAAYLGLSWRRGQTLAMRAWRLRLLDARAAPDTPPGLARCLMRLILATVALGPAMLGLLWLPGHGAELAAWLTLAPALAALGWALIDQDHQTLYDRLAGTRLVMLPVQTR